MVKKQWLYEKAVKLYKNFDIADMGEDITSFESYWNVAFFNVYLLFQKRKQAFLFVRFFFYTLEVVACFLDK